MVISAPNKVEKLVKVRRTEHAHLPPQVKPPPQPWIAKSTLKKIVAAVAICFFAICAFFVPVDLSGRVSPSVPEGVITQFPPNFERMVHPEIMLNTIGNRACSIDYMIPTQEDCDSFSEGVEESVRERYPADYQRMTQDASEKDSSGAFARVADDANTGIYEVRFAINPKKLENQKKALSFLQKKCLQNPIADEEPENIVKAILHTHELIMGGLAGSETLLTPGRFRTKDIVVTAERSSNGMEGFLELLVKKGAMQKQLHIFQKSWERIQGFNNILSQLTKREREVWDLIVDFPPPSERIEEEMLVFAKRLKEVARLVISREMDAIEGAAEIHQKLVDIHPFVDGNGRVARAWMNLVLQLGGYYAVAFQNDDAYSEAISENQRNPGQFVKFLEKTIRWNRKQTNFLMV